MRLRRLGQGQWEVTAVLEPTGDCQVLDVLLGDKRGEKVLQALLESVPMYGMRFDNSDICKLLKPTSLGIWEFRRQPVRGPKLRITFFRDDRRIVLLRAFWKRDELPRTEVTKADDLKGEYFSAKKAGTLEVHSDGGRHG